METILLYLMDNPEYIIYLMLIAFIILMILENKSEKSYYGKHYDKQHDKQHDNKCYSTYRDPHIYAKHATNIMAKKLIRNSKIKKYLNKKKLIKNLKK